MTNSNILDTQVHLYSIDTASFYNNLEMKFNRQLFKAKKHKANFKLFIDLASEYKNKLNDVIEAKQHRIGYKQALKELTKMEKKVSTHIGLNKLDKLESVPDDEKTTEIQNKITEINKKMSWLEEMLVFDVNTCRYKINKKSTVHTYRKYTNKTLKKWEKKLDNEARRVNESNIPRTVRKSALNDSNIISQFTSTLTRTLGIKDDDTTTDVIVVRAFRYKIFENLFKNGFTYQDEVYRYFTSSAGQIRNNKSIWIKSKIYDVVKNKLMCGLSIEEINRRGSMNVNKFNAYTALCMTASVVWEGFDIRKAIVVDDFITEIKDAEVEYIDHKTYELDPNAKRDVAINHVDGAGICLVNVSDKSFQFRMPFFKGLMIPFSFDKFVRQTKGASPKVKDIYGKEWDIFKDEISIIFTKSQFKMSEFFKDDDNIEESWKKYQEAFEINNCEAAICKEEQEDFSKDKTISYQVLQTLNEMKTEELIKISTETVNIINKMGNDLPTMLKVLGADEENEKKNHLQRAIEIYPNLLNDAYSKEVIRDNKKSLVNNAKAGKLLIPGTKRTYIAPDLVAFAQWLFIGSVEPKGILDNGEVSCALYNDSQKLDVLRSPHLFREHCVRRNVINDDTKKWFITNDIYTSVHDLISKQLMFDVDGDDALIVSDPLFVEIAERHMEGIKPLEYKLGTAKKEIIENKNIYKALISAYSKNIGEISNQITKVWNFGNVNDEALKVAKYLVFESNACIDFAKTLWYPERSPEVNEMIKNYTKGKLPYFFKYAKGKETNKVEKLKSVEKGKKDTNSIVNQLERIIPNNNINYKQVSGKFDYKKLMKNKNHKNSEADNVIIELYEKLNKNKTLLVKEQMENQGEMKKGIELKVYKDIRRQLAKLNKVEYVADVLIKYLYEEKNADHKQTLWHCFGKEIVRNLELNILGLKRCKGCGEEIDKVKAKQYCTACAEEKEKNRKKNWASNKRSENKTI